MCFGRCKALGWSQVIAFSTESGRLSLIEALLWRIR